MAGLFIIRPRFGLWRIFQLAVHAAIPLATAARLSGSILSFCSVTFWTAYHHPILAQILATPATSFVAELQAIMMKCIAHPGAAQPVGRQADVILAPDLFIFQRVDLA